LHALASHQLIVVRHQPAARRPRAGAVPNIVQDTIIIGLFLVVATVVMEEKFLKTSAVGAVVIGFATADTVGNMSRGWDSVEKPFRSALDPVGPSRDSSAK